MISLKQPMNFKSLAELPIAAIALRFSTLILRCALAWRKLRNSFRK